MPTNNTKMGEILHKRTRNSKTWINFDGSYTTEIHGGDIHFEDEDGNLHNINTDLYDESEFDQIDEPVAQEGALDFKIAKRTVGTLKKDNQLNRDTWDFQALKVPFDAKLPRYFRRGYSIGKGADKLEFKPVGASPSEGYVEGNRITYPDAWTDTDVTLEVTPSGVKEYITLKSADAPIEFSFEVTGQVESELKLHDAWLADAEGIERDVIQSVASREGKTYVDLVADVSELSYPIVIDPTVTFTSDPSTKDSYISELSADENYGNSTEISFGTVNYNKRRGLIQFDLSSIPNGAVATEGYIEFVESNTGFSVDVHRVEQSWVESTVTWNNSPSFSSSVYYSGSPVVSNGRFKLHIPGLLSEWLSGSQPNYGALLKVNNESYQTNLWRVESSDRGYNEPKLFVNYQYPPTTPTLTTPNGGETWNASHTIEWNASTDADGDSITYQIQVSTDNGATWSTITSSATGTSYTHDFSPVAETSTAMIRIRAYDGTSYSAWDESDGVFTIQHNQAPNAPTGLIPSGGSPRARGGVIRFAWTHQDPNSNDPQSQFDLQWRAVGASTWNNISQVTPTQYYDMAADTFPYGDIEWRVRTYDQAGLSGSYSATETFLAGNKPSAPTITSPTSSVSVANPTVQWSSSGQNAYTLRVRTTGGSQVYEHIGGTNKAHTVQYDLNNGQDYVIELFITNADGLNSDADSVTVNVSYTAPADTAISIVTSDVTGTVTVQTDFPEPSGTQPSVSSYDVYRRESDGEWMRLAKGIDPSLDYVDFSPASGETYDYYVRTWGDNNTYEDSSIMSATVNIDHAIITRVSDFNDYVALEMVTSTSHSTGVESKSLRFAGRKTPVVYFGAGDSWSVDTDFLIKNDSDMKKLRNLANSREVLLYRDERGRRSFMTLTGVSESDVIGNSYYQVSLNPIATYYNEEV